MINREQAETLERLANAAKALGQDATNLANNQSVLVKAAEASASPEAYTAYANGAFEGALTSHSTVIGLLAVLAESIRDDG